MEVAELGGLTLLPFLVQGGVGAASGEEGAGGRAGAWLCMCNLTAQRRGALRREAHGGAVWKRAGAELPLLRGPGGRGGLWPTLGANGAQKLLAQVP